MIYGICLYSTSFQLYDKIKILKSMATNPHTLFVKTIATILNSFHSVTPLTFTLTASNPPGAHHLCRHLSVLEHQSVAES